MFTILVLKGQCHVFILVLPGHSCDQLLTSKNIRAQNASYFEIGTYPKSSNTLLDLTLERGRFFYQVMEIFPLSATLQPVMSRKTPPFLFIRLKQKTSWHLFCLLRCSNLLRITQRGVLFASSSLLPAITSPKRMRNKHQLWKFLCQFQ